MSEEREPLSRPFIFSEHDDFGNTPIVIQEEDTESCAMVRLLMEVCTIPLFLCRYIVVEVLCICLPAVWLTQPCGSLVTIAPQSMGVSIYFIV